MRLVAFFLLLSLQLFAARPTICLNMIVKDEETIIERCLASVKPYIDTWVICDTGSSDATKEKIRNYLKDIPGELIEAEWVNFEHNRNIALEHARNKADYLLFIDADEVLEVSDPNWAEALDRPYYKASVFYQDVSCLRTLLLSSSLPVQWKGAIHEILDVKDAPYGIITSAKLNSNFLDSARAKDPLTYAKDAQLLEKALESDPTNGRNVAFLAQCYASCGQVEKALEQYTKRSQMEGWDEETFYAYSQVAKIKHVLDYPPHEVMQSYTQAIRFRPSRAEPYYYFAKYLLDHDNPYLAYLVAKDGMSVPFTNDQYLVEQPIYETNMAILFADASARLHLWQDAYTGYSHALLNSHSLPQETQLQLQSACEQCKVRCR